MTEETTRAEDVEQLDALLNSNDDPKVLTLTTLDGRIRRDFPIETFSIFKTAKVLKMLAGLAKKVEVVKLLGEIMQLTQPTTTEILLCPHCKTPYDAARDVFLDEKVGLVGCSAPSNDPNNLTHICGLSYHLKDAIRQKVDNTEAQASRVNAALSAIPQLMDVAPDLLLDFSSLAIISNRELEEAYDSPNGIAELQAKNRKWLDLHCDSGVPFQILTAYLPVVGISFLARELGRMDKSLSRLLTSMGGNQ